MSKTQSQPAGEQGRIETDEAQATAEPTLSRDDAFETLSNQRRRFVLHFLQDADGTAALSDLAEQVAAWENDTEVAAISASERKTVYTSLQQFHLPKMDDLGVVAFDRREGEVALTEAADRLDIYLEVVDRYDVPWGLYYTGLSALGFLLVGLANAGVDPFTVVSPVGWTVFVLTALAVSSVSHLVHARRMRLGSHAGPPEVREG